MQLDRGTLPHLRPFLLGKRHGAVNMLTYNVNCTKITGEWQKFMYNPKYIINQHKKIKFPNWTQAHIKVQ